MSPGPKPPPRVWRPDAEPVFAGPALVDTHIWIWHLDGRTEGMAPSAVRLLRRCVKGEGLLVSDISIWEVGTKVAKGKLDLAPCILVDVVSQQRYMQGIGSSGEAVRA